MQLSGESGVRGSHDSRKVFVPESWQNVLRALELRSLSEFYQRQRRFADDDAVS